MSILLYFNKRTLETDIKPLSFSEPQRSFFNIFFDKFQILMRLVILIIVLIKLCNILLISPKILSVWNLQKNSHTGFI